MEITTSWMRQGQVSIVMRQIKHKFGEVNSALVEKIESLNSSQLEDLGEALLDFSTIDDLVNWLNI